MGILPPAGNVSTQTLLSSPKSGSSSVRSGLKSSERITLEKWRRRGIKKRVFGAACVFLKQQI
jgi:hypothetical protein